MIPSHRSSHHQTPTRPNTYTRYHSTVSYTAPTLAWLSLLLLLAASQRGAFLAPFACSVYHHTTAAARDIDSFVFYLSNWVVSLLLRDVGRSFRWRNLLPMAPTVSTSFHLYGYYSLFIARLLRVVLLLLPPPAPSSGAYYTVSDDRVFCCRQKKLYLVITPSPHLRKKRGGRAGETTAIPGRLACNHQTVTSSRLRR